MGSVEWKFAKIVKVGDVKSCWRNQTACESCEFSSSSSDSDSSDDSLSRMTSDLEIPVRVGGCEKWITGLTRRTTCDDVIYALVANESNANDVLDVQNYAMFERWREVERPLKGRTKILKVWRAWGSECRNVKFFIRKSENPYDSSSEIVRPKRHTRKHTGHSGHILRQHRDPSSKRNRDGSSHRHHSGDRERSRRRSHNSADSRHNRQYSRSLERRLRDYYGYDKSGAIPSGAKYPEDHNPTDFEDNSKSNFFHYMVKLILDQEKMLSDQTDRIRKTDEQIDKYETMTHVSRMEKNGRNYVQDAYLRDKAEESSSSTSMDDTPSVSVANMAASEDQLEEYIDMCEKVLDLEEKLKTEENRIEELSSQFVNESTVDWDNHSLASGYSGCEGKPLPIKSNLSSHIQKYRINCKDEALRDELMKVRREIERSVALSVAQQKQLALVDETLGECEHQLQRKRLLLNQLLVEVDGKSQSQMSSLSKFMSKSCEAINERPKLEDDHLRSVDDLLFSRKDNRNQYNSDSGVESVDHKPDIPSPKSTDVSIRSEIDVNDVPYVKKAISRTMVPYRTYTTYEKDGHPPPPPPRILKDVTQGLTSGCRKSVASEDSNSDTGLSSLHSEEHSPILETLV